ncbi:beta-galactosidase [Petrotoga sp. HKA.pet.4.5]|uniref:beta-galactosidase n=1 Tax=Petrotoga sp. HKA.pet.4.5 TaxID=1473155 RepID=UPI000EF16FF2|nr:beta-galactosidase [Petrotoga sp. HKA.pet.4.5]RLL89615.1 beta-galactosidase [Petrotoga sp. HKA.pet.4.5]
MTKKYEPINAKVPHFLHGADYNPDQWLKYPEVLEEDIRLMKLAGCNVMSVGIFAWSTLEPEEGKFNFGWLDKVIEKLYKNGIYTILATPSGARPAWMSQKYPEVLRVGPNRVRNLHGKRHNHCYTSPVYREKVNIINTKLAERYSNHPGVIAWHVSNEYGGECHCELCQESFRNWLKEKYKTLENLNDAWWTAFWSHTYTDWSQIESPAPHGENLLHGLNLDWKRFVTHQTVDFFRHEIEPLKKINPSLPVTTNFMGIYEGLDYWKFVDYLDVISWDNYPIWHSNDDYDLACGVSMVHDLNRSLKNGKPFMLMESTPSTTNWHEVSKLKKPGMHLLSSIQAVAHGSDTVQYFQWRKSRGSSEKFHGAVVDHCGYENTRVFNDVKNVGETLKRLDEIIGTTVDPEVAIIFDWENRWAMKDAQGPRNIGIHYEETVKENYKPFWKNGVPVDVINMDCDFSKYKLLIAPMLYMVKQGVGEKIKEFVKNGGTFVATYWSGIVNETDLCFLGGFPGPLREVLGIWSEEIDALYDGESRLVSFDNQNELGLKGEYEAKELCDLIHLEGARSLATYKEDFYKGMPALTVNDFSKGKAYYIASRNEEQFNDMFYGKLIEELRLKKVVDTELPYGITAQIRTDGENDYIFVMNFTQEEKTIELDEKEYIDLLEGETLDRKITVPGYGVKILKRTKS